MPTAPTESKVLMMAPVPLGLRVKLPLAEVNTLRAPESVMVLAVKVSVPIAVLATKVPTPEESILAVPAPAPVLMDVTALIVPGPRKSDGIDSVTAPVEAEAVIWLAVPVMEVTPPQPAQDVTVKAPAWVILKLAPEISLPVPELVMATTSPLAEESDWVTPKTDPVSVPVPEMLEVNWTKLAVSLREPVELVTTVLLARMSDRESAAVRVPERLN